eukprot:c12406_g1_i5.p1 GENE.c12406_g1_i5~~c12406_g1_i5.p1  ORF type:complete len:773 (+),score=186.76 c12406_g1_i5:102-2420(+)
MGQSIVVVSLFVVALLSVLDSRVLAVGVDLQLQTHQSPDELQASLAPPLPLSFCAVKDPPRMKPVNAKVVNDKTVLLSWELLPESVAVSEYQLEVSVSGGQWSSLWRGLNSTRYSLVPYSPSQAYRFRIKAINCASGSEWSFLTRLDALPVVDQPLAPSVTERTSTSVRLQWRVCVDNPHALSLVQLTPAAHKYDPSLALDVQDSTDWQDVFYDLGHEVGIPNLEPGHWYWIRLAYVGGRNTHVWSHVMSVRTVPVVADRPPVPEFRWTVPETQTGLLTWMPPAYDGGAAVGAYLVELITVDYDDDYNIVYNGSATALKLSLKPGRTFGARVRVSNEAGLSEYSPSVFINVPPAVPSAPAPVRLLSLSFTTMTVQWSPASEDGGANITSYVLMRGSGRGLPLMEVWRGNAWTYTADPLYTHTHYRWRVAAINSVGVGALSEEVMFKTQKVAEVCPGGDPPSCFGHGTCDVMTQTCNCDPTTKWTLDDCSGTKCEKTCKAPFGTCDFVTGMCQCSDGKLRMNCQKPSPCPDGCGPGFCGPNGLCVCPDARMLPDCSHDCSARNDCNSHGKCTGFSECECDAGFESDDCSQPQCFLSDGCSGHGSCTAPEQCVCDLPYTGDMCDKLLCADNCMGRGKCIGKDTCVCLEGSCPPNSSTSPPTPPTPSLSPPPMPWARASPQTQPWSTRNRCVLDLMVWCAQERELVFRTGVCVSQALAAKHAVALCLLCPARCGLVVTCLLLLPCTTIFNILEWSVTTLCIRELSHPASLNGDSL